MMEASQHGTDLRRDTTMCGDPKSWYPMRVTYSRELSGYSLKQEAHELLHYRVSLPFWRRKKQRHPPSPRPLPIWRGCKQIIAARRRLFLFSGKAGRRFDYLSAGAERDKAQRCCEMGYRDGNQFHPA